MSEYRVDFSIPIRVMKRVSFIYVGPDFRSLPVGVVSDIVTHRGRELQRLYPFTVSKNVKGSIVDQLFCFIFFYVSDDDERTVFLTQPIHLTETGNCDALEALLAEVDKLAKFIDSNLIEIELHEKIEGQVAFPSSLSFLSYVLEKFESSKMCNALLEKSGFREALKLYCLETRASKIESYHGKNTEDMRKYDVDSVSPLEYMKIKENLGGFWIKSFILTNSDSLFKPNNYPFFEDSLYSIRKRSRWQIRRSGVQGYMRWLPNIMEQKTPFPLLFLSDLENREYKRGKIFDWGLKNEDFELFEALLFDTMKTMIEKGIRTIQFSNITDEQKSIKKFLESHGFEVVHKIRLLRKKVN